MSSNIATGSCLCGAVRLELTGKPLRSVVCYCNDCRKNSGNLGQFCARVDVKNVLVDDPHSQVSLYEITNTSSGVPKQKQFCKQCGSTIQVLIGLDPGVTYVRQTLLDEGYIGVFEPQEALFLETKQAYTGTDCTYF